MKDSEGIESSASAFGTCRQRHAVEGTQRGRRGLGHAFSPGYSGVLTSRDGELRTRLIAALDTCLRDLDPRCIAFFWPFQGEPDLRSLMEHWSQSGITVSLPAVETTGGSATFLEWEPGGRTGARLWGIPIPHVGNDAVEPDVIIIPLRDLSEAGLHNGSVGQFYRDAFARFPDAVRIGVGTLPSGQDVHASAGDSERLDFVITGVSTHLGHAAPTCRQVDDDA